MSLFLCPLCGKRPAARETEYTLPSDLTGPVCRLCRDHVFIGTQLVKKNRIAIMSDGVDTIDEKNRLMEPVYGEYQLQFLTPSMEGSLNSRQILKYWDISLDPDSQVGREVSKKILNSYVPFYDEEDLSEGNKDEIIDDLRPGDPKSLNHIAAQALNVDRDGKISGIDALGVLKADVDHLGMLMACGLGEKRLTISRLAALSRQINYYFGLYMPHLLMTDERFKNIYTVFAGGDDLFLIGPWNRVYELSLVLDGTFADYVCRNPAVHFSAGISLQKAHTPLNSLAETAENALQKSKSEGRNRFTMFFETATWEEMKDLENIRRELETWLEREWLTKSMMYRLNEFITMAAVEKKVLKKEQILKADMDCLKWRALFYYSAKRNVAKKEKKDERERISDQLIPRMAEWLDRYEGRLRIPLWHVLYNHR